MKTTRTKYHVAGAAYTVGLFVLQFGLLCLPAKAIVPEFALLLGNQIGTYDITLNDPGLPVDLRLDLEVEFHQFVFEYWLICRTNKDFVSPDYRERLRRVMHTFARNTDAFNDPGGLLPYFRGSTLGDDLYHRQVVSLDYATLDKELYQEMVRRFQYSYYDPTNTFPVYPIPTNDLVLLDVAKDPALARVLTGLKWPLLGRDRLPRSYRKDPAGAFAALTVTGRAYFLPGFLRMCEMEEGKVRALPERLLSEFLDSKELIGRLTSLQRQCVLAFMEDWFLPLSQHGPELRKLKKALDGWSIPKGSRLNGP